ncbi:MAG: hypothetical protein ACYDAK_12985 [Candidatus Limnocylindrales bacterium]
MTRNVKRKVSTPREATEARAILARYYEAERAFPGMTQRQIAATLLPSRRDPSRLIRQLRSGERLGVARKEVAAAERERREHREPGAFVSTFSYIDTATGQRKVRRVDMRVPGAPSRLDVFRIARRPAWKDATIAAATSQHRIEREHGSPPLSASEAATIQLVTVRRPKTAMRGRVVVVAGLDMI